MLLKNGPAGSPGALPWPPAALAGRTLAVFGWTANDTQGQEGGYVNQHPPFIRTTLDGVTAGYPLSVVRAHEWGRSDFTGRGASSTLTHRPPLPPAAAGDVRARLPHLRLRGLQRERSAGGGGGSGRHHSRAGHHSHERRHPRVAVRARAAGRRGGGVGPRGHGPRRRAARAPPGACMGEGVRGGGEKRKQGKDCPAGPSPRLLPPLLMLLLLPPLLQTVVAAAAARRVPVTLLLINAGM